MKDELVNNIVCMLDSMDVDTEGIADRLYILMKDIEIKPMETALALRDDALNEQLLKRFLAAKMVKGCTKRTIDRYRKQISWTLSKFGKSCTEIPLMISGSILHSGLRRTAYPRCRQTTKFFVCARFTVG